MPLFFTKRMFNKHSVSIAGAKGKGKDMLMGNVIARRKSKYYISNTDYKIKRKRWIPLHLPTFLTDNNYNNFIKNKINQYFYKYPDKVDIYISDCGVYFPSQYNGELNRDYKEFPTFMALSRHLGDCYVHTNCQAPNRVWDKIREQSDRYIRCVSCLVIGKIVFQVIRVYDKYESFCDNVAPYRSVARVSRDNRQRDYEQRLKYLNTHGSIKTKLLIYRNKTRYDTRLFKTLLEGGDST